MTRGNRDDYTRLSWILSRSVAHHVGFGITLLLYGLAFATFFMPAGVFPFAPPLIIAGLTVAWFGILLLTDIDGGAVAERLSQTGWQKETTTHVCNRHEVDDEPCNDPECDEDIPADAEIAERYAYDVLYVAGTEITRKVNTERRICPEHADEDALDVDLYDPREEEESTGFSSTEYKLVKDLEKMLKR